MPTPSETEAQTASDRLASPGAEHGWMQPLVGRWAVAMRVWPGPSAEPFAIPGMTAERHLILGGRYLREDLIGADGVVTREATLGYNRLEGRFELVTVDAYEPGQMIYTGRGDETPGLLSLHGVSIEAGMASEPTGRKRDLRFDLTIDGPDSNSQRIHVRYPGGESYLFVEQIFTRTD